MLIFVFADIFHCFDFAQANYCYLFVSKAFFTPLFKDENLEQAVDLPRKLWLFMESTLPPVSSSQSISSVCSNKSDSIGRYRYLST
jgi:hypothetical protein